MLAPMPKYVMVASRLCRSWLLEPSRGQPASHGAITERKNEAGADHKSQKPKRLAPDTCTSGAAETRKAAKRPEVAR